MSPMVLAVICVVIAAVLAVVDLLVPSGGVLAVASLVAALVSVYFGFQSGYTAGVLTLTLILVAIPIFIMVALRLWPHTPIGRRVILQIPDQPDQPAAPAQSQLQELIGQIGVTQNALMPCGFIRLNGRNYNAMCESGVIEAKQNVIVTAVQQRNLIVASTSLAPSDSTRLKEPEPTESQQSLLDRPAEELGLDSLE
jgi:membrane-bound ClpP family serine protease